MLTGSFQSTARGISLALGGGGARRRVDVLAGFASAAEVIAAGERAASDVLPAIHALLAAQPRVEQAAVIVRVFYTQEVFGSHPGAQAA